jgi:hypothetical protein
MQQAMDAAFQTVAVEDAQQVAGFRHRVDRRRREAYQ